MKQKLIIFALVLALGAGLLVSIYIAPPQAQQTQFASFYPQPRVLKDFNLKNQHGDLIGLRELKGKWTLAFVGYTFCPDICPTTLAELKRIYPKLQAVEGDNPIQVLFISVDPKRDSVARLNEYIQFFNPEFIAASAKHKVLFPLVRSMGMMYAIEDSTEDDNYLVGHSGAVVIINPEAQVIGRFKPELQPGKIAVVSGDQILADMPAIVQAN